MSLINKLLSCFVLTSFLGHLHHSKWSIAISGSRLLSVELRLKIRRPWRSTKNINILTPRVGFGMLELDSCILNDIELIMCDHEFYILGVIIKSNATSEGKYLPVSSRFLFCCTYCDTGPQFIWSHPLNHPNLVTFHNKVLP